MDKAEELRTSVARHVEVGKPLVHHSDRSLLHHTITTSDIVSFVAVHNVHNMQVYTGRCMHPAIFRKFGALYRRQDPERE